MLRISFKGLGSTSQKENSLVDGCFIFDLAYWLERDAMIFLR